jgi:hypothetical protein
MVRDFADLAAVAAGPREHETEYHEYSRDSCDD